MARDRPVAAPAGRRQLVWLQRALCVLFVTLVAAIAVLWWQNEALLLEWKRGLDPGWFYAVLAVGGALGLPTTPFYIAGGALFGLAAALAGTALAVAVMQALAFVIAHGPLRDWSRYARSAVEQRLSVGPLRSPAARVLLVRLVPLVPTAVKSYASASVGASFSVYLSVSWVVGFAYAAAMVMLGDSAMTGNVWEGFGGALIVAVLASGAWYVRRRAAARPPAAPKP